MDRPDRQIDSLVTTTALSSRLRGFKVGTSSRLTRPRSQAGLIEIELGDGRQIRVDSDVKLAALRRVLIASRG